MTAPIVSPVNELEELVDTKDQVWVLGDLSLKGRDVVDNALAWISARPGSKHLIAGNHDAVFPGHRDSHKHLPRYLEVFDSVQQTGRRKVPRKIQGEPYHDVLLSHFPYQEFTEHAPDRFTQWWLPDHGRPILHGHVHTPVKLTHTDRGTPQVHCGLDAWNLSPVALEQIAELL